MKIDHLEPIQKAFLNTIINTINSDPKLINFSRRRGGGRTTAINFLDKYLYDQVVMSDEKLPLIEY